MIHVIAMIELQEGTRGSFLEQFHGIMAEVHKEEGCIEYGPTTEVDTGNEKFETPRANVVTIIEKRESPIITPNSIAAYLSIRYLCRP